MSDWYLSDQKSKDAPACQEEGRIILSAYIAHSNPIQNSYDLKANNRHHADAYKNAEHWAYSGFKHFELVLTFNGRSKISLRIPVIDDRIDLGHLHSQWFDFELR
jgi:hypothetical protein